ncbi:MAG: hypothetical protein CMH41_03680 [Micrococcales bacterium]|nr:hypothetical protein [Micrococcales bacterium]
MGVWKQIIETIPWWSIPIFCFILISGLSMLARGLAQRSSQEQRLKEIADYSQKLTSATATGLFVLIGFCITMSWSTFNAGQSAIDSQFSGADRILVALDTSNLSEQDRKDFSNNLAEYLDKASTEDIESLRAGQIRPLPSDDFIYSLELAVIALTDESKRMGEVTKQLLVTSLLDIVSGRAELQSVSNRVLPAGLLGLVFLAAMFVAMVMGASMSRVRRPYLLIGWALVMSLALSVLIWLSQPFYAPLEIDVKSLSELADVAREPKKYVDD